MKQHTAEEIRVKLHQADEMARNKFQREIARRVHELELENSRLRYLVIDLILEKARLEKQLSTHPNQNLIKQAH
jgi:hypothetical protein